MALLCNDGFRDSRGSTSVCGTVGSFTGIDKKYGKAAVAVFAGGVAESQTDVPHLGKGIDIWTVGRVRISPAVIKRGRACLNNNSRRHLILSR